MRQGYAWWHVMWHTYGAWLPGDPRGFRNKDHRIHSSGDYKKPPPIGEHAGLHQYAKRVSRAEVVLNTSKSRQTALESILAVCDQSASLPVAIAVCRVHVHLLAEMPIGKPALDKIITRLKTKSSASIRDDFPGRAWARGDKRVMKRDRRSQLVCLRYVLDHAKQGAATWRYTT
ncbi:MAG: hypothetical protein JWM57_3303 [Phycisphaerales bacterium]|nr:hypothetical protein [Phycisphaerales bacterium]